MPKFEIGKIYIHKNDMLLSQDYIVPFDYNEEEKYYRFYILRDPDRLYKILEIRANNMWSGPVEESN